MAVERSPQSRILGVLAAGQILGGLGMGASISTGALLLTDVSGDESLSGLAATMLTLGAGLTAIPLARLAGAFGRRRSLTIGAGLAVLGAVAVVAAASAGLVPPLLVAFALLGAGTAAGLQARFAAADLATPRHRARDLSLVVWATTIGAVAGPNLLGPGGRLAELVGVPQLAGPFLITIASQVLAGLLYLVALRPDPLLRSRELAAAGTPDVLADGEGGPAAASVGAAGAVGEGAPRIRSGGRGRMPALARFAIASTAASHAVMVGVMAMTPVHLTHHGASLEVIGITISLHVAGMYALSPVFGVLADRLGRVPTILLGQLVLIAAVLTTALGADDHTSVTVGLILLGLGWSASTVAGSALVTAAVDPGDRPRVQGVADLSMNLAGAAAGALGGVVLASFGYSALSLVAGVIAVTVIVLAVVVPGASERP